MLPRLRRNPSRTSREISGTWGAIYTAWPPPVQFPAYRRCDVLATHSGRSEMWDDAVAKPESDSTSARFTFGADSDLLRMRLGSPSSRLSLASSLRWLSCTSSSNARRPGYVLAPPRSLAPAHLTGHATRDRVVRQRAGSRRLTTVALLRRPLRQGHRLSRIWTTWRSQSMIVLSAESSCVTLGSVTAVLL